MNNECMYYDYKQVLYENDGKSSQELAQVVKTWFVHRELDNLSGAAIGLASIALRNVRWLDIVTHNFEG